VRFGTLRRARPSGAAAALCDDEIEKLAVAAHQPISHEAFGTVANFVVGLLLSDGACPSLTRNSRSSFF
jgi:hypothetical protein